VSDQPDLAAGVASLTVEFRRDRSRVTTLIQPLLALPQYLVVSVATLPLLFLIVYSWFALLITARWPSATFRWISGWLRAATRAWAYLNIISAAYPPWTIENDPNYEVRLLVGPPKPRYSRSKVLFRLVFVIPAWFLGAFGGMLLYVVAAFSWLTILATGRQSEALFCLQRTGLAWFTLYGLLVNLITEDYDWDLTGAA